MNRAELQTFLSQPPASFAWSASEDGTRSIGAALGAALDLTDARAQLVVTLPPDNAALAGHNGVLMQLLLVATRRDWHGASAWLSGAMRQAARWRGDGPFVETFAAQQVCLTWHRAQSQAVLEVELV